MKPELTDTQIVEELRKLHKYEMMLGSAHKANVYMFAADMLEFVDSIPNSLKSGEIGAIKGIGPSTVDKIYQLVEKGKIDKLEDYKLVVPESVLDLMEVKGLGPKTAYKLYNVLGVDSFDKLKSALDRGEVQKLSRINTSLIDNMFEHIEGLNL